MKKAKEKLYIIPGFGESTRMQSYREIIKFAREQDFFVVPIKVEWDMDKTMSDYIKEVEEQIPDENKNDVILGFSFGAYIAYLISKKKIFKDYIFCTISPYFKENLKDIPQESKDYFGPKFINNLKKYSLDNGNGNNAYFLTGGDDWELAIKVNKEAQKKWGRKSTFQEVKGVRHDIGHRSYTKAVKDILKKLRA